MSDQPLTPPNHPMASSLDASPTLKPEQANTVASEYPVITNSNQVDRMGGRRHIPGAQLLPAEKARSKKHRPNAQFLPTLFDRLRDDYPSQNSEAPEAYVASKSQYRAIVQRDLTFLLNTTNHQDLLDKDKYPEVVKSTLNYGVAALAGGYLSERKWIDIEKMIREAILNFEPRLMPSSLSIRPLLKDGAHSHYNVLLFEITALLHASPYPMEFTMQSAVDLETSRIELRSA